MHHLDPSLRHQSWTPEEDQALLALEVIQRTLPGSYQRFGVHVMFIFSNESHEVWSIPWTFIEIGS